MNERARAVALPMKIVYVVVAVVCLLLGLLGLVMPVIPGLLFLLLAFLLLGKVSRRIRIWSRRHPALRSMRLRMASLGRIGFAERLKLAAWMSLEGLVKGLNFMVETGRNAIGRMRR